MNRNILKLLLSAAFVMCCTFSALADLGTPPDNEIWYTTDNNSKLTAGKYDVGKPLCGTTISEHGESDGHYYIKFNANIEYIDENDFDNEDHITEVSLPSTITSIREMAFNDCDGLVTFHMPNSVINLGYCAFYHCDKLKNLTLGSGLKYIGASDETYGVFEECDELEVIAIPASVILLGRNAFYDCDKLKFVAIGSGVTSITEQAFYNCNELMSVAIDGNVVSIGNKAFNDCEKLESVSFFGNTPPSSFGDECFYDCSPSLKYHVLEEYYDRYNNIGILNGNVVAGPPYNEIWYSTNNGGTSGYSFKPYYAPKLNAYMGSHGVQFFDGNPPEFNNNHYCFEDCTNLVSAVLPSSINSIGLTAFYGCSNLVSVSIPSTVTGIGEYAFSYCYNLQNIKLPDGLNYIGNNAFVNCGLKSITIPSGVGIPENLFHDCPNLRSVTILGTVQDIGHDAFFGCSNLSEIFYLGEGTPNLGGNCFDACPATIYVKDVAGHGNWGDRPVRSWRSGRGDGSAASPLEIGNYPQLYGFSLEVEYMNGANLCAKLTADITGSTNVLNEDGTPKGVFKQWLPIGSWGSVPNTYNGYTGEFDGGGHTVSGLYFNDETKAPVGLFGMADGAYIHDVGVKDSYFRGKSHVAGICGDLASGRMENCWNAATVQAVNGTAGGMAGSCWRSASMSDCHNTGKVAEGAFCGGVCGSVAKNTAGVTYSVSNCFSLEGKCSVAYNLYEGGVGINNVSIKNAAAFASGEVCWTLNGSQTSDKWRQQLGVDGYPTLSGDYFVYYSAGTNKYYNYDDNISGSGTADDPYRIGNWFELLKFADIVNTQNTEVCGILTADITMNTGVLDSDGNPNSGTFERWTPIGGEGYGYKGEFNGNGHTISGLHFDDYTKDRVGLFGKTGDNAYIHDLGIKDSYFYGNSWVAGICGDFASGRIENCWNAATVFCVMGCAGGIAASCWTGASMTGCYNIGMVRKIHHGDDSQCGGICGTVARNGNVEYSVSNCISLYGKCDVAYNLYEGGVGIHNVSIKDAEAFASGEVCWILNGSKYGGHWRQQLGTDDYPTLSGTYFVNYTSERQYYNNEPTQEIWYTSTDGKIVTPYMSNAFGAGVTCNTYGNGQGIITFDKAVTSIGGQAFRECSSLKSIEIPDNVTSIGEQAFRECSSLQSVTIPSGVTSIGDFAFFRCVSLPYINIPSSVTSIGDYAFRYCSIKSIEIPCGVTNIGSYALANCNNMESITFKSLPSVSSSNAFYNCNSLSSKILDLTDSYKPFIGTSLENYPSGGFTEAHYHGTLEPGEWGTIILPFVPSSHSGIVFFSIDNVDAANGTLTLSIVENIVAGKPYLFRNQTGNAGFTLTATPAAPATEVPVNVTTSDQIVGSFALKGTFQASELTGTGLYKQQGGEFVRTSSLSIDPFRAYLKDNGGSGVERIVIDGGTLVKITNQDDSTITLYGVKEVEFVEQDGTPAVRVTYADNSTVTYENPKKVEFKKE